MGPRLRLGLFVLSVTIGDDLVFTALGAVQRLHLLQVCRRKRHKGRFVSRGPRLRRSLLFLRGRSTRIGEAVSMRSLRLFRGLFRRREMDWPAVEGGVSVSAFFDVDGREPWLKLDSGVGRPCAIRVTGAYENRLRFCRPRGVTLGGAMLLAGLAGTSMPSPRETEPAAELPVLSPATDDCVFGVSSKTFTLVRFGGESQLPRSGRLIMASSMESSDMINPSVFRLFLVEAFVVVALGAAEKYLLRSMFFFGASSSASSSDSRAFFCGRVTDVCDVLLACDGGGAMECVLRRPAVLVAAGAASRPSRLEMGSVCRRLNRGAVVVDGLSWLRDVRPPST